MSRTRSPAISATPTGREGNATAGGLIASLIDAARRQEALGDLLTAAVDSGDSPAIIHAANNYAANCPRDTPVRKRTTGREEQAMAEGLIATLIEAARRQETLGDLLTAAVDSRDSAAILEAAHILAANRRRDTPAPTRKSGREKKSLPEQT